MSARINMVGQRYGRLLVTAMLPTETGGKAKVLAVCDCGTAATLNAVSVRHGGTRSCGCLAREFLATRKIAIRHGQTKTRTYRSWLAMQARCLNKKHEAFPLYGGRGIKICERWLRFENFMEDMGVRPPDRSLDRVNNDGDYEPTNCRWATSTEQARNRRSIINVTIDGETKCLKEWCRNLSVSYDMAKWLIRVRKLPPHIALTQLVAA